MKPKDMLELRGDLAAKLSNPSYRSGMAAQITASTVISDFQVASRTCDWTTKTAAIAENFFVIPEMCDLVAYSATVLDSSDITDVTLAPSRAGFAYFVKPLEMIDIRQNNILVNAMLWDTATDGSVVVHMWNDEYVNPDDAAAHVYAEMLSLSGSARANFEEWKRLQGRWGYAGVVVYRDEEFVGDERREVSEDLARQYEDVEGVKTEPFTNPVRLVHAFFLMLSQTLVAREHERGDRKSARRMKTMGVPNDVTIITFRRTKYEKKLEGEAKVEWNHRWLVRGFWRWQPYKDDEGKWARKRIWINPYVKGPEDKPLVITNKINAFVR
jgi:hypothetical protein